MVTFDGHPRKFAVVKVRLPARHPQYSHLPSKVLNGWYLRLVYSRVRTHEDDYPRLAWLRQRQSDAGRPLATKRRRTARAPQHRVAYHGSRLAAHRLAGKRDRR